MFSETIELRGHIIDSLILPKVLDQIVTHGASFNIKEIKVGQKRENQSFARIEVRAESSEALDELILRLRQHGAEVRAARMFNWPKRPRSAFFRTIFM